MGLDFLILFVLALAFFWYAGRVIDDVLDKARADEAWWREFEAGRDDYRDAL